MTPHPDYFIGTGGSWVHCVALNVSAQSPIVLCNDGVLGWTEGVRRLANSLDPLVELDVWLRDTVVAELDSVESQRIEPIPKLEGNIVLSGAAFEAAVTAGVYSEKDQLNPIAAKDAIATMASVLVDLRETMADSLLDYKTAPSLSSKYAEGEKLAMDLCNLTLHIELLGRMVDAGATLFFKNKWTGIDPVDAGREQSDAVSRTLTRRPGAIRRTTTDEVSDDTCDKPTWVVGWYMHLLSNRFGAHFGEVDALMGHLDGLYANAVKLANMYDEEHAGSTASSSSAMDNESVALTLVTMQDVVEALRQKAKSREPVATEALLTLMKTVGGRMDGLDFKFKSEESLYRKLIQRLDRQLKANEHIPHCACAQTRPPTALTELHCVCPRARVSPVSVGSRVPCSSHPRTPHALLLQTRLQ